jgi:N-acetylneuraminic acid mutarotase
MRSAWIVACVGLMTAPIMAAEYNYPPLPKPVSSLGAVACDGYLYIYGGHAGKTHSYDNQSVLGTFHRLKLDGGTKWEELPGGPIAQGMNLATHGGKVYRVGGMSPQNAPGEPKNNRSLAEAAVFDPKSGKWAPLPDLPVGRSSHDLVVVGDKLIVVGGWQMKGTTQESEWPNDALQLDLRANEPKWEAIPQPFKRRALTATVANGKVYVLGGLGEKGTTHRVDIYDVRKGEWSHGPDLPEAGGMGFSPAAATVDGRVVVNTLGGPVYRLTADGTAWEKVGEAKIKRMVHRMIPNGPDAVLLVGGAGKGGNVAELEVVTLAKKGEKVAAGK